MKRFIYSLTALIACAATAFAQDYTQVYLIGGATANGWDSNNPQTMTAVEGEDAVFTWTGVLTASDFKFLNAKGSWDNCFHATTADEPVVVGQTHTIVFNNPAGDFKFKIASQGIYTVTVDLRNLTMVVTEAESDLPTALWIIGTAVPDGVQPLVSYPKSFKYFGSLTEGEVKIMTTESVTSETRYIVPVAEDIDIVNSGSDFQITDDATLPGWTVTFADSQYRIDVNLQKSVATGEMFTPWSGLYIVGGCTSISWAADQALPFAKDGNVYTWEGELANRTDNVEPKLFKLLGQLDWGPNSLHPYIANESILTSEYVLANTDDDKWQIADDGNYKIVVDLFYETIEGSYTGPASVSGLAYDGVNVYGADGAIRVEAPASVDSVSVYNAAGQLIASAPSVDGLSAGLYFVRVKAGSDFVVKKVIVK